MAEITLKQEQLDAINHQDGDLLISASAGSGKTFVMIERLIRLIKEGKAKLNNILAVTFTEAAASEMKEKLKKALRKEVSKGNLALAPVISQVDLSDITTIHSFCGRLVRRYFFVAGVSPDFGIMDANQSAVLKTQTLNKVFKSFYASGEEWFLTLVDKFLYKRQDQPLRNIVSTLYEKVSGEADPLKTAEDCLQNYTEQGFNNALKEYKKYLNYKLDRHIICAENALASAKRLGIADGEKFCNQYLSILQEMLEADAYTIKNFQKLPITFSYGKKIDESLKAYKEQFYETFKALKKEIASFIAPLNDYDTDRNIFSELKEDAEGIVRILKEFSAEYTKEKFEENLLDFNDLEHFALKVLRDENAREAIKNQYEYIFIDEYQDVNGVQDSLMNLMGRDNTFMVGDLKQSIYGFRGCRSDFFANKYQTMKEQGQGTLELNYNFRSADAVINMVNKIFNYSMTTEKYGMDYTSCQLKSGGGFIPDAVGRAEVHSLVYEKQEKTEQAPKVYDILKDLKDDQTKECAKISALVSKIIEQELNKKYYSVKDKDYKRITYGDICILTRGKETPYVAKLVNGLVRHGIPVVSEVQQSICSTPEIQTLINVLKLIDSFSGDIPLAVTLKSPIAKLSEEDLAEIAIFYDENCRDEKGMRVRGSFFDAYNFYINNAQTTLSEKLKKFNDYFGEIRLLAPFLGAQKILEKLLNDCDYFAELYAMRLGEQKANRVRKFLSECSSNGKELTVSQVLSLVEENEKAFGLAEIADENTVKVMTMHASKGLEFPVVIVCGLEKKMHEETGRDVCFFDRDYLFATKYFDKDTRTTKETILRGIIKNKAHENGVNEELRLFYVATTRATYSLHLTIEGETTPSADVFLDAKSFSDCLPSDIPITIHNADELGIIDMAKQVGLVAFASPDQQTLNNIKANFNYQYPYKDDITLPLKSSVTKELGKFNEQSFKPHFVVDEETTDIERGLIAHKIMENLDFAREVNLKEQVSTLVNNGILTDEQVKKINIERIQKVFDQGVFAGLENKTLYREKTFISAVDASEISPVNSSEKVVIQGAIDLIAVSDDGAEIIDYKYSSMTMDSLKQKYSIQLKIYAKAFTGATGIKVDKLTLVNLFTGEVINL